MNIIGRLASAGVLGMALAACAGTGSIVGPDVPRRDDGGFGLGSGGITAPEKPAADGIGFGSGGFVGESEGEMGSGTVNGSTSTTGTCTVDERGGFGLGPGGRTEPCATGPTS